MDFSASMFVELKAITGNVIVLNLNQVVTMVEGPNPQKPDTNCTHIRVLNMESIVYVTETLAGIKQAMRNKNTGFPW
jgi:hypothetical protein